MSSGPIRGTRPKHLQVGLVVSSMKPVTARTVRLYGIGRNIWIQLSSDVEDDQDRVDEDQRADVVSDVVAGKATRRHPRIRAIEARTAARNASAAPASASASRPASVLPPRDATAPRTEIGS